MLSALDADKVSTLGVLLIVGLLVVGVVVAVLARAVAVKVLASPSSSGSGCSCGRSGRTSRTAWTG